MSTIVRMLLDVGSRMVRTSERRLLKFILPFRLDRILKVLKATQDVALQRKDILKVLENEGMYTRMAETYFYYCIHWGLIAHINDRYRNTPLGEAILRFSQSKLEKSASELLYYSFASSKQLAILGVIVNSLFGHLEMHGPFSFTNADIGQRFATEFKGRSDISDSTSVFHKVGILRRENLSGRHNYMVDYYSPTLSSFTVSLMHYVQQNQLKPPHNVNIFDCFRAYWFLSKDSFVKYLRQCRAMNWLSYQEFAGINQFEFGVESIPELTERVLKSGGMV